MTDSIERTETRDRVVDLLTGARERAPRKDAQKVEIFDNGTLNLDAIPQAELLPIYHRIDGQFKEIDNFKKICRVDDTEHVYQVGSDIYKPIQHRDALDLLESAIAENPEYGTPDRKVEIINDGAIMFATYTFSETKVNIGTLPDGTDDLVSPSFTLRNSYNMFCKLAMMLGAFRWFCSNGQYVGIKSYMKSKRHTTGLEIEDYQVELSDAFHKFSIQTSIWKKWSEMEITQAQYKNVIEKVGDVRNTEINYIEEEVNREYALAGKLTVWMFYNILTALATHHISNSRRHDLNTRIAKAFKNVA